MSARDGGPAFPVECQWDNRGEVQAGVQTGHGTGWATGMSLRDYFAAVALNSELMTCGVPGPVQDAMIRAAKAKGRSPELHMARNAYDMADAMLAAREVQP